MMDSPFNVHVKLMLSKYLHWWFFMFDFCLSPKCNLSVTFYQVCLVRISMDYSGEV